MVKKKKNYTGHYCKVCHQYKANEKFSGKGHTKHICKACQNTPISIRKEMEDEWMNSFEPIYREEAKEEPMDPEIPFMPEEISLTACSENIQQEIFDLLVEEINDFIIQYDYLPASKHKRKILEDIHKIETDEYDVPIKNDQELSTCYDKILSDILQELKEDDITLRSYEETLMIAETQRLIIRKLSKEDLPAINTLMEKPEIMYGWEHGFSKKESHRWINRQMTCYHKDGYGYFAVILKESGKLIGQVGLFKSVIQDKKVVELGYIFDNVFLGIYGMEAAKACVEYALVKLKLQELYHSSIRPCNTTSICIAVALGMNPVGELIVRCNDTDMSHLIYRLSV